MRKAARHSQLTHSRACDTCDVRNEGGKSCEKCPLTPANTLMQQSLCCEEDVEINETGLHLNIYKGSHWLAGEMYWITHLLHRFSSIPHSGQNKGSN